MEVRRRGVILRSLPEFAWVGSRGSLTSRARRGALRPRPKSVSQPGVPAVRQSCSGALYLPRIDRVLHGPLVESYFKYILKCDQQDVILHSFLFL